MQWHLSKEVWLLRHAQSEQKFSKQLKDNKIFGKNPSEARSLKHSSDVLKKTWTGNRNNF